MSYVLLEVSQIVADDDLDLRELDEEIEGVFAVDMYGSVDPLEGGFERLQEVTGLHWDYFNVTGRRVDLVQIPADARWL